MLVQTYHALRGRRCVQLIVNAERKCGKLSDRYLLFLLCVCRQVLKRDVDLGWATAFEQIELRHALRSVSRERHHWQPPRSILALALLCDLVNTRRTFWKEDWTPSGGAGTRNLQEETPGGDDEMRSTD